MPTEIGTKRVKIRRPRLGAVALGLVEFGAGCRVAVLVTVLVVELLLLALALGVATGVATGVALVVVVVVLVPPTAELALAVADVATAVVAVLTAPVGAAVVVLGGAGALGRTDWTAVPRARCGSLSSSDADQPKRWVMKLGPARFP